MFKETWTETKTKKNIKINEVSLKDNNKVWVLSDFFFGWNFFILQILKTYEICRKKVNR